jgi:hypothetical protein
MLSKSLVRASRAQPSIRATAPAVRPTCTAAARSIRRRSRRRAREETAAMPSTPSIPTLARIALAVDPTPEALSAARYTRTLLRPGMQLRIVCAIDNPRLVLPDIRASTRC